jgi:hypothetical protein
LNSVRTDKRFGVAGLGLKPAAYALSLFLLLGTALSVNPALHSWLHPEGTASDHTCLACSVAKALFTATEASIAGPLLVLLFLGSLHIKSRALSVDFEYRPSLGRGPPVR